MKKVKDSRNRPGVAQRVPGGLGSQIPWHSAHEGGEVSLTHRPHLHPGMFLVLIFDKSWVDPRAMERSEGNVSLKNPVTPPGIEPGIVRLVAQRLNHYATPGTINIQILFLISFIINLIQTVQFPAIPVLNLSWKITYSVFCSLRRQIPSLYVFSRIFSEIQCNELDFVYWWDKFRMFSHISMCDETIISFLLIKIY
jgi:hypothetical protein